MDRNAATLQRNTTYPSGVTSNEQQGRRTSNSGKNGSTMMIPPGPPKRESLLDDSGRDEFIPDNPLVIRETATRTRSHPIAEDLRRGSSSGMSSASSEFQALRPSTLRLGERTISTTIRLRRQGFKSSKSSANFAVKSLRRGSTEWNALIRPFVSDLAFRCLAYRRFQSEITYRPYTCYAAVLFVDLSNYSKITGALADRGAHAISSIVNGYLGQLLEIIHTFGGDCVKFAGDAILVVWEGPEHELEINTLTAAACSMDLQEKAGNYSVEGTAHSFRIHCGLACGRLESEIFQAPVHQHMQRLYHSVSGETLIEISELVDYAKAGEVCISDACLKYLGTRAICKDLPESVLGCRLLTGLTLSKEDSAKIENYTFDLMSARLIRRNQRIEEEFIHPSVLNLLSHGGLSPTQIAQMRNLCVLFVAKTSNGSSVNWLMEVQCILDRNRCPIVQLIDDDKGIHLVAAINLYESMPETSLVGLDVCRDLIEKQVGCAIGMALGPTFCGVTGCSSVACRWDITGPCVVRAARLMQYALKEEIEVAIDESVFADPMAAARMAVLESGVRIKGASAPVTIYGISENHNTAAFRVLETVHGRVHDSIVEEIYQHIIATFSRCAALVTGIPLSGKKIICQRAAGHADLVPYLHVSDLSAGFLQLAKTIATWFLYTSDSEVQSCACGVLEHLKENRWSRAHDECIELVNVALSRGLNACFIVDRIQFLDDFSLSLLRECLHGRSRRYVRGSSRLSESSSTGLDSSERIGMLSGAGLGKICFLCVHVSLYNYKTCHELVDDITRSHKALHVPIIKVGEATRSELRTMFHDLSDMEVADRWLDVYSEASGFCAGYFVERAAAIRKLSGKLWSEGKQALTETTEELALYIPPGNRRISMQLPVHRVSADVAMRFSQLFDGLPPLFQTFSKVLAIATKAAFYNLPKIVAWEALNDLITDGVEQGTFNIVLDEMRDMNLLRIDYEDGEYVLSFQSPALGDIAREVSTPVQMESIGQALVERLEPRIGTSFKVRFVLAILHHQLKEGETVVKELWLRGYEDFLDEIENWTDTTEINKWHEIIDDEMLACGLNASDILGKDFSFPCVAKKTIGHRLPLVKIYTGPVAFGPMSHTLNVITRNMFHEFGIFHGYDENISKELRKSTMSAAKRYLFEVKIVEEYLTKHGFPTSPDELKKERDVFDRLISPASSDGHVQEKAALFLDTYIPEFIEHRLTRLLCLVEKLRLQVELPCALRRGDETLKIAYERLRTNVKRTDAAQDALMIMANRNWKPKQLPEPLPILYYQTVARLRNKSLTRLTDAELFIFRHQQTDVDLECFLITTALLNEAYERDNVV